MSASNSLLLSSVAIGVLGFPLILKLVPPNRIYGFRTPRTVADRALWFRVNRFAGWAMLAAGSISASIFALAPGGVLGGASAEIGVFVVPLLIALAITGAYVRKTHGGAGGEQ